MITWRCWSKTLSALLATSKIVTFATRLNTSQGRINRPWEGAARDALFAPATVYLNPAALQALGVPPEGSQPRK